VIYRIICVQDALAKSHGSQCGFCTPGFVMSMYTLVRAKHSPSHSDLETAIQGTAQDYFLISLPHFVH